MSSKKAGKAVQDASDSSFGTAASVATPSSQVKISDDIACVKAAIQLARETGDTPFLRLAHNKPRYARDPAIVNGKRVIRLILDADGALVDLSEAEAFVKALQLLWSDDPSINLDPAVIRVLANSGDDTKSVVPPAYARAFILDFCQRAERDGADGDWDPDSDDISIMIDDAFASTQAALGKPAEDSNWVSTGRVYDLSKELNGKMLLQIKGIADSIIADADARINTDKLELENLESLQKELAEKMGDGADTAVLLHDICRVHITQAHGSMEAIRQRVQLLSKFLEGSIEILQSP